MSVSPGLGFVLLIDERVDKGMHYKAPLQQEKVMKIGKACYHKHLRKTLGAFSKPGKSSLAEKCNNKT